ncbi:hypothetical protein FHT70_005528 [Rhizobium sp. BK049]|uniref:DUF262 domain-containing protein n=1 Tax=Rhizobium sp. BK049 TaxID=2587095 RepID=UPI00180984D9|nr:DUF262 domain-containing protein [Rhizobium sp. BK049]MBB3355565.1 hypothetical protein [Rhizobium sp. BK049]
MSFYQLIEGHGRVEVPVIQRDYAQGRPDQHIVRDDFLKALHDALCLPDDDPALPLDLDFVYGSVVNGSFQPLDGQQRLTTLYLLHWYLAWVDGYGEDFRGRLIAAGRSRFGYEVRPGSRDFLNALACYAPDIAPADCPHLGAMITDEPWYFRSWQFDPTIRSALVMLDRIHEVFRHTSGLYARLIYEPAPAITFQLLDLEQFDLSDDLYIKMNARGKPLTPFETFKARFERHLENQFEGTLPDVCGETPISDFFSHRMDTRWSDFFWPFRDRRTATFDDAVMNLLRVVIMVTRAPATDGTATDLADLRSSARPSSYTWFHERSWLDREMVVALITLLERWNAGSEAFRSYLPDKRHLDEQTLFQEIITRPTGLTFQQIAQLAGYVQYLVHARGEIDTAAFGAWMRVVSNLVTNTDYNRPEDLRRSLAGLRDLAPWMDEITRHLAGPEGDVRGFFRDQVAEERIKAHLIELGDGWPERIERAEHHPYFRGQIGFLLHFCGFDLDDPDAEIARLDAAAARDLCDSFEHYLSCAVQMFDDLVMDPPGSGRRWERALLAIGDFLLFIGRNYTLLVPAQDEAWSWKRLLRNAAAGGSEGQVLKDLWERLGEAAAFEANLADVIASASDIDPWRAAILTTPAVYNYGLYRMLRFSDEGRVYLLRKSQMNGKHAELFTYCLYEDLKNAPEPLSLTVDYYESSSTDDEPGLSLSRRFSREDVTFYLCLGDVPDAYELYLGEPREPGRKLRPVLEDEGFEKREGWWTKLVGRDEMKDAVLSLDRALAQQA